MSDITNSTELNEVITQLITPLDYGIDSLGSSVDHAKANSMFSEIENDLNNLYVKTRLLEDLNDFTEQYIQKQFKQNSDKIIDAKKTIEKDINKMIHDKNILHEISFNSQRQQVIDRTGVAVDYAEIFEAEIIPANVTVSAADTSAINVSSNTIAYRRLSNDISQYRTFYCLSAPMPMITEQIQILFSKTMTINMINLSAFKSSISSIKLIREDNELIDVPVENLCCITSEAAKGINITLNSNAYDISTFNILDLDDKSSYNSTDTPVITNILDTVFATLISQKAG